MSAAEKLKALDKQMRNIRTRRIVTTVAGHDLFVAVSDALPQIVAVISAAEYVRDGWLIIEADNAHLMNAVEQLDPALDALDEALS